MESIKEWLNDNYFDNNNSDGYGASYGDGHGSGLDSVYSVGISNGSGYGNGFGYGDGSGYGYNLGSGLGCGVGYGDGYGYDDGSGDGYGISAGYGFSSGCGFGTGTSTSLKSYEGKAVYLVDGVSVIIEHTKGAFAKGFILNSDLTLTPCYIAKGHGYFAHGKSLKEARRDLMGKIFKDMNSEEVINTFLKEFKKEVKYSGTEFFEWHHYLTGSCLMGRETFVKNRSLDLDAMYTVDEFIAICENDYGGEIIRQLKRRWQELPPAPVTASGEATSLFADS